MKRAIYVMEVLFLVTGMCYAGSAWRSEDSSTPFLIRVKDNSVATIAVSSNTVTIANTTYSTTTNISLTSRTVSDVVGIINSFVNSSGGRIYDAVIYEALGTDSVAGTALKTLSAVRIPTDSWCRDVKWQTAQCLHFSVVPDVVFGDGARMGGYYIKDIYGDIGGSGAITVIVYVNGNKVYQTSTTGTTSPISITFARGIYVGVGQRVLVRAVRATTASTGGIGVSIE